MSQFITVSVEAGNAWRGLSRFRRAVVWLVAHDLYVAARREAQQAEVLGVPDPRRRITGRASDLGRDWL